MLKAILETIFEFFSSNKEDKNPPKPEVVIENWRTKLPVHPTRKYGKRPLSRIKYLVVHQSGKYYESAETIAEYHITPGPENHLSEKGAPGIAYHYVIERDGTIKLCNNESALTWHCKNHNTASLGILVNGNFDGPEWKGEELPTLEQIINLDLLLDNLTARYPDAEIKGHGELVKNKINCPGNRVMHELNIYRS